MKNLEDIILEMTKEIELNTIEWIFRAIDKVKESNSQIRDEVQRILNERYGESHSRDKVYAQPGVNREVINNLVGENVYNVGMYWIQRGVNRNSRSEKVIEDVSKDYSKKRDALKNKILKLADKDSIKEISTIFNEGDRLGCKAYLEHGDVIEIYSITAGGWNIQKFHFRGLAKRIKAKK